MKPSARTSPAERMGQVLGRMWRAYLRQERKVSDWLVAQGLPVSIANAALLVVKLGLLGVLLYVAFWLALLLVLAVVAAGGAGHGAADEDDDDFLGQKAEEKDHRDSLFYHPASYNDDPDPRFEDD